MLCYVTVSDFTAHDDSDGLVGIAHLPFNVNR